ncbi:reverse transcriptase domain-containing protein [Tanacetum coccineum]
MHTHASKSELFEPLPKPERTLNRRLHRRNRRVPFEQRNNPPQHPRIVYPPILNINYFCHFLDTDRVVAPTPGSAITIPETANEFAIKEKQKHGWTNSKKELSKHGMNFEPLSLEDSFPLALFDRLLGEIRAFTQLENESLTDAWVCIKEMLRNYHGHNLSKGNNNFDTDKIMARMDAMTMKIDAQYKDFQSRSKQPNLDDDEIPMSHEEEAKFMQTFCRTHFYNDYHDSNRSFQYPVGIAENMLVEVGKFTFPANFVILKMEEDSKVPLILERPFLHTVDAVIRVKQKQLNLGVRTERMIFNIDSAIKHSYSNDDTCFSIYVIDEILEEDFDALLDEGSEILHTIEGTILKEKLFIKTYLEEPLTDLELKNLPDNLEYVFLEEPSFLPVIISSQLYEEDKNKLASILKNHKRAFAWKTTDIPGICPYFSLQRCNLVLNWEKCHFMVKEGIVLGHKVSEAGLEVDKSKIDVISKHPPPTNIKEFEIEIKDRKGTENVTANHLSITEKETIDDSEIDDNFLGETLMEINTEDDPWLADFANYLVRGTLPLQSISDGMIRRCVSGLDTRTILDQCHHGPTGGHYRPNTTAKKS